jgi:hypothetical protein
MLIGVDNPSIMLSFQFVIRGAWRRIPLPPESFDELVSFSVGIKMKKNVFFRFCDDIDDFLLKPSLVDLRKILA